MKAKGCHACSSEPILEQSWSTTQLQRKGTCRLTDAHCLPVSGSKLILQSATEASSSVLSDKYMSFLQYFADKQFKSDFEV